MVTLSDSTDKPYVSCTNVVLENTVQMPPHSEIETTGRVPPTTPNEIWTVENSKQERNAVWWPELSSSRREFMSPLRLFNLRDEPLPFPKGPR